MLLTHEPPVHFATLPNPDETNRSVLQALKRELSGPDVHHSHYELGRYENTYIPLPAIPEIEPIRTGATLAAQSILQRERLKLGFWFNIMRPGDRTARHNHEEEDELLSCVYYLSAPRGCGDLLLYPAQGEVRITPVEGRFVFFSPKLAHAVDQNRSGQQRVSVAFNFGQAEST